MLIKAWKNLLWTGCLLAVVTTAQPGVPDVPSAPNPAVEKILAEYIKAVGGAAAVERIQSRQIEARRHHGPKLTYYWQKPNRVLLVEGKVRIGYDGGSGWMLSSKKRVTKLGRGAQLPIQNDANPLRYVYLHQLYSDISPAPRVTLDGRPMDVLVAPNELGSTKLFFDAQTHLLARIDEKGEVSAYYQHVTDYQDYQDVNGVKFPFQIEHRSTEPSTGDQEIQIKKVEQNVDLRAEIFARPKGTAVVLGGKR